MAESKSTNGARVAFFAGVVLVGIVGWVLHGRFSLKGGSGDSEPAKLPSEIELMAPRGAAALPALEIAESGRLRIQRAALSERERNKDGPLEITLGLSDLARGDGRRGVRIISVDGRKLETYATPRSEPGSGVLLEVDSDFLTIGRYMIEVDTVDNHPLRLRRYVVVVE